MKKLNLLFAALAVSLAGMALAAGYSFLEWPANGEYKAGTGPVKIVAVDAQGDTATNGTVVISRITAAGAQTNALFSATCTNGVLQAAVNNIWIFTDDVLLRTGTAAAARVRVVVER